ncbi:hypothetical protein [Pseudomonas putida]|uniref:Uncharacterized protein n=1 Tax=Pseudomonas putida TaxID=303 RepID=A0AAW6PQU3_PSEPU|nr:hypothetical protein [Pseudomonas putida]MDF3871059.1 hypothetical protein [Pseudomonas putida]MDF3876863.1 hypothetical protein [Pseudomonas putida]
MTNKEIYQQIKHYKSLRAAAVFTGNRAEGQRCSDMLEILAAHITCGARYER